jgi:hypothetical protein
MVKKKNEIKNSRRKREIRQRPVHEGMPSVSLRVVQFTLLLLPSHSRSDETLLYLDLNSSSYDDDERISSPSNVFALFSLRFCRRRRRRLFQSLFYFTKKIACLSVYYYLLFLFRNRC